MPLFANDSIDVVKIREAFDACDMEGTGVIDRKDLSKIFRRLGKRVLLLNGKAALLLGKSRHAKNHVVFRISAVLLGTTLRWVFRRLNVRVGSIEWRLTR